MKNFFALIFLAACVGIWYFSKKRKDKKMRNYSIIAVVVSIFVMAVWPASKSEKQAEQKEKTEKAEITKKSEEAVREKATQASRKAAKKQAEASKQVEKIEAAESNKSKTSQTSSSSSANATASENQKKADDEFKTLQDGSYPYASGVHVETKKDGSVDYVELEMFADWYNFDQTEKQNYIGVLKGVAAPFMTSDGKLPFMQVKAGSEIVARSEVLDVNKVKILK